MSGAISIGVNCQDRFPVCGLSVLDKFNWIGLSVLDRFPVRRTIGVIDKFFSIKELRKNHRRSQQKIKY